MKKRNIVFDEVNGFVDEDGSPLLDSASAHRIVSACGSNLNAKDMGLLLAALVKADMITKAEADAVGGAMSPEDDDAPASGMASDAAIRRGGRPRRASEADVAGFYERFPGAKAVKVL